LIELTDHQIRIAKVSGPLALIIKPPPLPLLRTAAS
jgi:hypothetical protein